MSINVLFFSFICCHCIENIQFDVYASNLSLILNKVKLWNIQNYEAQGFVVLYDTQNNQTPCKVTSLIFLAVTVRFSPLVQIYRFSKGHLQVTYC